MTDIQLIEELKDALAKLPRVTVDHEPQPVGVTPDGIDMMLDLRVDDKIAPLGIVVKKRGDPKDIREALWRLERIHAVRNSPRTSIIVAAPRISATSRVMLRDAGIGYWDRSGSLYLGLPWAFYFIERDTPSAATKQPERPFRGQSAQVLHVLLLKPNQSWKVNELAESAQVSPATAHRVLAYLERQLWVEKQGTGPQTTRVLLDPSALLDAWASSHTLEEYIPQRFHGWSQSSDSLRREIISALDRFGIPYALTLASGVNLVAPFAVGAERLTLLFPDTADLAQVASAAGLSPVESGENVTFFATRDGSPLMFRQQIGDACVASDVQLYLDLWAWPMRGKEQAIHLRKERLAY